MLLLLLLLLLLFLPVLRMMKMMPRMSRAITATPPTAPPTMAPIGVDDFDEPAAAAAVGEAELVSLDFAPDAEADTALVATRLLLALVTSSELVVVSEGSREWSMDW